MDMLKVAVARMRRRRSQFDLLLQLLNRVSKSIERCTVDDTPLYCRQLPSADVLLTVINDHTSVCLFSIIEELIPECKNCWESSADEYYQRHGTWQQVRELVSTDGANAYRRSEPHTPTDGSIILIKHWQPW